MKWISIKDRLPDKGGNYLIYCKHPVYKNSNIAIAEFYEDNRMFYEEAHEDTVEGVTHWAEEPEPPESKGQMDIDKTSPFYSTPEEIEESKKQRLKVIETLEKNIEGFESFDGVNIRRTQDNTE